MCSLPRSSIPFHIQQSAQPAYIEHILSIVSNDQVFDAESLRSGQGTHQIPSSGISRSLQLGKKLGLFEKPDRSIYKLTARGRACRKLALFRREVYCDVMHFLLFATWELGGRRHYWSWSYAKTCEIFWHDKPSIRNRKAIFGQLSAEAAEEFPDLDPVVGTETVYAVTNWLRELSPPFFVLENNKLLASEEREWFSVELALLAVSYLHATRGAVVQTPLLLDGDTVELLSPLCLASVDRVVAMIETASRTFPFLDIHTGEWGSSVVLRQAVDIPMLI